MDKTEVDKITEAEKIRRLVERVDEGNGGISAAKARYNHKERKFLKKHSDWIIDVFKGNRTHVKANAIVDKMKAHGLGVEDLDSVLESMGKIKNERF